MSNEDTTPLEADAEVEQQEAAAPEDHAAGQEAAAEKAPDGAVAEQAAEAAPEVSLEAQLAAAQRQTQDNLDGWQRTLAEFQNYRKRVERDLKDSYQRASLDMVLKLLPIVDDFERGMAGVPEELRGDAWLEGIELIQRKFLKLLDDLEIVAIDPVGEAFDPSRHEAVGTDSDTDVESGRVTATLQKGYVYKERVLRPALVRVAQ